jgi:hypothetical protein
MEDANDKEVTVTVNLVAHKEKLQKETVVLWARDKQPEERDLQLVLQGRVLGNAQFCQTKGWC